MRLRLFVAIEIDDVVRGFASAAAQRLVAAGVTGRFEPPEKFHVTVAFLGAVAEADLAASTQALREASARCQPFELCFSRIGAFPSDRRPRVLWVGPPSENPSFTLCAGQVRESYERLGFTFDHDATPHITICRPTFAPPQAIRTLDGSASQRVTGLSLMRSLPAGQTTRYEALERISFRSGEST